MEPLKAEALTLSYKGSGDVVHDLSVKIPRGAVTSIIGPNGCGKSTLLRALSRLLKPRLGTVFLDGEEIHRRPAKEVARRLGLLTQQPSAPEAITVEDLMSRGRYPPVLSPGSHGTGHRVRGMGFGTGGDGRVATPPRG